MRLGFLDFETNGDDPKTCLMTEVGLLIADSTEGYELSTYNSLIYHPGYPPLSDLIVELTGINDDLLKREGRPPKDVLPELYAEMEKCDLILAHNKSFDQGVLNSVGARLRIPPPEKRWICTLTEVPYPKKFTCKKLAHLAFDHGMVFDPTQMHRAMADVRLLQKFIHAYYSLETILAYADQPWVYFKPMIAPKPPWTDGGAATALVKKAGFWWEKIRNDDPARVWPKTWIKRMKSGQVLADIAASPFEMERIFTEDKTNA